MKKNVFVIGLCFLLAAADFFLSARPGFVALFPVLYFAATCLTAAFYGTSRGLLNFSLSFGLFSAIRLLRDENLFSSRAGAAALLPWAAILLLVYIFGKNTELLLRRDLAVRERWRSLVRRITGLKKLSDSLYRVNRELEERTARQQDSITLLYRQVQAMNTLNVKQALNVLLDTVGIFLSATKASIWAFDGKEQGLKFAAAVGWDMEKDLSGGISLEGTLEGWVFRNNSLFSIRMLLQYENLRKLDTGRNIITLPLHVGRSVWGVLNIEDMPFEKYSFYSERLLQIITGLAEPHLERALEYDRIVSLGDVDEVTGLPQYSQFYRMLEGGLDRAKLQSGVLSVIIFEIGNFGELSERLGRKEAKLYMKELIDDITLFSDSRLGAFHYREDGQFVVLSPNLDHDGASLYCLESLEKMNRHDRGPGYSAISAEVLVGYATARAGIYDPEQLLRQAEHLLALQKV
jgi:GGDEF domain-containing protein